MLMEGSLARAIHRANPEINGMKLRIGGLGFMCCKTTQPQDTCLRGNRWKRSTEVRVPAAFPLSEGKWIEWRRRPMRRCGERWQKQHELAFVRWCAIRWRRVLERCQGGAAEAGRLWGALDAGWGVPA